MFDWILRLFKKKPKKTSYKKADFTKYRYYKGERQYYCSETNEWLYWYLLLDIVTDDSGESVNLDSMSERQELDFANTGYTTQEVVESAQRYTSSEGYQSAMESIREECYSNRGSYSSTSYSGGSSYSSDNSYSSGSSSSSSYDSSSSGSCSSSSSGGGCD